MKLKGKALIRNILIIESIGIALLVLLVWSMEYFDMPFMFMGGEETPVNTVECIWESVLVLLVGATTIYITRKLLIRLEFLEGLLHICSFCKKIKVGDRWITLEEYIITETEAVFSHGFCPECGEKHYGEYYNRSLFNQQ